MRQEDKKRALDEVVARVLSHASTPAAMDAAIAETIYHEHRRIEKEKASRHRDAKLRRWDQRRRTLLDTQSAAPAPDAKAAESAKDGGAFAAKRALLEEIARDFATEVCGNFDPKVYSFTTRLVPVMLSGLLNAFSPSRLVGRRGMPSLHDRVIVDGEVAIARELKDRGTLIVTPTHISNLDSIVLGYGFYENGFPPLTYGAGLNLFTNPLISYFMHNLGAYKVDRRKTAPLYKEVLKEYATVLLEFGYHNLFFPGGTRARSGAIEDKLKLGLLGAGLRAYINNLRAKREKPNVYVVPVTISSELVLEAETLIDDFLKETGQSRYIIADDEFSQPSRIYSFFNRVMELDARIYITLASPLDVFGNSVRNDGVSVDARGRPIDPVRYVIDEKGEPHHLKARDEEYTRELGQQLVKAFHKSSTVMGSHLLAFAVYEALRAQTPGYDLYRFLRSSDGDLAFADVSARVEQLRVRIEALVGQGRIRIDERLRGRSGDEIVLAGLRALGIYHKRRVLERRGDRIVPVDRNLLYYYRNRLLGFGLEEGRDKPFKREGASARVPSVEVSK